MCLHLIEQLQCILITSYQKGVKSNDAVVDAKYLAAMKMPNRDAFIQDTRPDVKAERCMSNCKPVNSKL